MSLAGPFLFDPRAFWGDENVRLMTGEQVAAEMRWKRSSHLGPRSDGARSFVTDRVDAKPPFM